MIVTLVAVMALMMVVFTIGVHTYYYIKESGERVRRRYLQTMMNPGYATALCSASRKGLHSDAYKDWIEKSEAAWNERAEMTAEVRKCLDIPAWDGVAVEAKSLLIPAPEIFTQPSPMYNHLKTKINEEVDDDRETNGT